MCIIYTRNFTLLNNCIFYTKPLKDKLLNTCKVQCSQTLHRAVKAAFQTRRTAINSRVSFFSTGYSTPWSCNKKREITVKVVAKGFLTIFLQKSATYKHQYMLGDFTCDLAHVHREDRYQCVIFCPQLVTCQGGLVLLREPLLPLLCVLHHD